MLGCSTLPSLHWAPKLLVPKFHELAHVYFILFQIKYIFTDKTGTLTRNVMTFRKCSTAGVGDKPVFGVFDKVRLKPVSSATETS